MKIYNFNDYGSDHSLKLSPAMWLWIVYSMRHLLLFLGLKLSGFSNPIAWMSEITVETHWTYFLCGIPTIFLLVAMSRCTPKAGAVIRWIWHNGRNLLASSLALHLIVSLALAVMSTEWYLPSTQSIFFLFDFIGFIYLYRSQRVKDVFSDFPL